MQETLDIGFLWGKVCMCSHMFKCSSVHVCILTLMFDLFWPSVCNTANVCIVYPHCICMPEPLPEPLPEPVHCIDFSGRDQTC